MAVGILGGRCRRRTWRSCAESLQSVCRRRRGCDGRVLGPRHRLAGGRGRDRRRLARCTARTPCAATSRTGSTCSTTSASSRRSCVDVGDDRVLAIQRVTGAGEGQRHRDATFAYAGVSTVRDGKIVRGREYLEQGASPRSRGAARAGDDSSPGLVGFRTPTSEPPSRRSLKPAEESSREAERRRRSSAGHVPGDFEVVERSIAAVNRRVWRVTLGLPWR